MVGGRRPVTDFQKHQQTKAPASSGAFLPARPPQKTPSALPGGAYANWSIEGGGCHAAWGTAPMNTSECDKGTSGRLLLLIQIKASTATWQNALVAGWIRLIAAPLRREKQQAGVTERYVPQHRGVVIDDKNKVSIWQANRLDKSWFLPEMNKTNLLGCLSDSRHGASRKPVSFMRLLGRALPANR